MSTQKQTGTSRLAADQKQLKEEITRSFDEMIVAFSSIDKAKVNIIPFKGSWTAGQVAEHMVKSAGSLSEFFSENIAPSDRAKDQMVMEIRRVFLDFTIKMKSPDFILPASNVTHNRDELLERLKYLKGQAIEAADTHDLSDFCKSFEFPGWGYLTKWEWLVFIACHMQRHAHQLRKIQQALEHNTT